MAFFRWIKKMFYLCYNNRVLRYIWYGGWSTIVNIGVFYLLRLIFHVPRDPANVVSVAAAILFAYYVNSRFVFESKAQTFEERLPEFVKFVSARLSTMVIEVGGVWLMSEVLHINDLVAKVIIQVVVLILNYIFSKFLIFTKKEEPAESSEAAGTEER